MKRTSCLVCDSISLKEIVDLGSHPFADTFIPVSRFHEPDTVYPLVCDLCLECGHVQTRYETSPLARYSQVDYSYTSSNSTFSRTHWESYAKEIGHSLKLTPRSLVVEVGSNDGYLAEQFILQGNRVIGVDPSPYMAELAAQRNVNTITGLFDSSIAQAILKDQGKADLVIANNVFNHADNPLDFTNAVATLLASTGSFVFEQPYWLTSIQSGNFDQIYHEHVSYFTVKSAAALLKRAGLVIVSASVVNYHGGSLRIIAQRDETAREASEVRTMILQEESAGLFDPEMYRTFMHQKLVQRARFLQKIHQIKEQGHPIIAVGAAAKGNTFLNFYKLDHTLLDYVTDSSPHKQWKYTPATRIPIVGDEIFSRYEKVYALILSWNIAAQLKDNLMKINPNIEFISPGIN